MKYKKTVLLFLLLVIFSSCLIVLAMQNEEIIEPITCRVYYQDKDMELVASPITVNGRLYLPSEEEFEDLEFDKYTFDDVSYISLYDIAQNLNLAPIFKDDSIYLYDRIPPTKGETNEHAVAAYLRLEDVSADMGIINYTHEDLEKMRAISDFMYENGQNFYIAWIPLYTNPIAGVQNNLMQDFSLYNADFIYTFDYMTRHGGNIVLHGLTHQEDMNISGIGSEFSKDSTFTENEIMDRLKYAKETAEFLGFDNDIFEFPHYAQTEEQLKCAERLFDVIYQQDMRARTYGQIEERNGTMYVPAPNGFLESEEKLPQFLDAISNAPETQIVSMYIHPYMEFENIMCHTNGGMRVVEYSKDGIFPQLVERIKEMGMEFSTF